MQKKFINYEDKKVDKRSLTEIAKEETKTINYVENNMDKLIRLYYQRVSQNYGLHSIVSSDDAIFLIPGYSVNDPDIYYPAASLLTMNIYEDMLINQKNLKNNTILFTAGGSGSGKTTALKNTGVNMADYAMVYDSTLADINFASGLIDKALKFGYNVEIIFTQRDPVESFINGVLPRAIKEGRQVSINAHSGMHSKVLNSIIQLEDKYKDQIKTRYIDNTSTAGISSETSLTELPRFDYTFEQLKQKILQEITRLIKEGRISSSVAESIAQQIASGNSKNQTEDIAKQPSDWLDPEILVSMIRSMPYVLSKSNKVSLHLGRGKSSQAFYFATKYRDVSLVDINPVSSTLAYEKTSNNLSFQRKTLNDTSQEKLDGIINYLALHTEYSTNNYDPAIVRNILEKQVSQLNEDGTLVINSFVQLNNGKQIVNLELSAKSNNGGLSDAELLVSFSQDAYSNYNQERRGFLLTEIPTDQPEKRSFSLPLNDAVEFLIRKDDQSCWNTNLKYKFTFWTKDQFEHELSNLGLRLLSSLALPKKSITDKAVDWQIFDNQNTPIELPAIQWTGIAQKVSGKAVKIIETDQKPIKTPYVQFRHFQNIETSAIFDLASRPGGDIADLLPYYYDKANNKIFVMAKKNFPRPLINTDERGSSRLNQWVSGGYIIEPISVADVDSFDTEKTKQTLLIRAGIKPQNILAINRGPTIYTSPGGLDEIVYAKHIQISGDQPDKINNYSDLTESGTLEVFDIQQILESAQIGSLPEARLELNCYFLLRSLGLVPEKWLGEKIVLIEGKLQEKTSVNELFAKEPKTVFQKTQNSSGFLEHINATFTEVDSANNELAEVTREFIIPKHLSTNTIVTLPVVLHDGEVFIGLEERDLPAPQIREGNSRIITAPAFRLPKSINSDSAVNAFIKDSFEGTFDVKNIHRLAGEYYPSIGITPERVTSFFIAGNALKDNNIQWVSLKDTFSNLEKFHDGHLAISVMRLVHALGLWEKYLK
ncbi:MAG TPA: hypothetical protein DF296_03485 [Candidatus Margulisbacteria bacterium]|nr:hypothetical protein [Candidatus Margulisiibacteriota bacterium]